LKKWEESICYVKPTEGFIFRDFVGQGNPAP